MSSSKDRRTPAAGSFGGGMFNGIKKIIKVFIPHGLVLIFRALRTAFWDEYLYSKKVFKEYYHGTDSPRKPRSKIEYSAKKLIYMADGRTLIGGLSDRLGGMVTLYEVSREIGVEFKINFTSPVELTNYLIPHSYDWTIDKNDIIYDTRESVICNLASYWRFDALIRKVEKLLKRYNQIHANPVNAFLVEDYGRVFDFLFKPSKKLSSLIEDNLSGIGAEYISATFRFQALLGDFYEGAYPVLPEHERGPFIDQCLGHLEEIHRENPGEKILVTSESITFLNAVKKFDFVYVIPGEIAHIDYSPGLADDIYMKSFVDYFLLTRAKKSYLVIDGQMYNSTFAYRASLHRSRYIIKRYK